MTKFSVIVPTYNERRNIGILYLLLRKAFEHPSLATDEFEIIVVDDNSPDGTQDVVKALQREYGDARLLLRPRAGKLGLGTAYVHGLLHASGEFVLIMDADMSHHPKAIPEFIAKQREGDFDVVTGTRYVPGGGVHGKWEERLCMWNPPLSLPSKFLRLRWLPPSPDMQNSSTPHALPLH
jgi:dolichol-phosphate mannosyltransferase